MLQEVPVCMFISRNPRLSEWLKRFSLLLVISPFLTPDTSGQQVTGTNALCDSAYVQLDREEFQTARALFVEVLSSDPENLRAIIGMGRACMGTPRGTQDALEHFEKAVTLAPQNPAGHYYKALAHLQMIPNDLIGHQNARAAEREFEQVIELDPSHPDAYFRLGALQADVFQDFPAAIDLFSIQISAYPGHEDSWKYLLKTHMDLGDWESAITAGEELLQRKPGMQRIYSYLAGAYWKSERADDSMRTFERYFALLDKEERDLYFDLRFVLDDSEQDEFQRLGQEGRTTYWNHYWTKRDPDPKTVVNERLLEHFIRVAWARIQFGQNEWPWDSRGNLYVRYGEPDYRSGRGQPVAWNLVAGDSDWINTKRRFHEEMGVSSSLTELAIFDADMWDVPGGVDKRLIVQIAEEIKSKVLNISLAVLWERACEQAISRSIQYDLMATPERWVYRSHGIDIDFEDYTHNGSYSINGIRSRVLTEQMEKRLPTISPEEDRIEYFSPLQSVVTFRGTEGKTVLEYAIGLQPDDFGQFRSQTGAYAYIDTRINLFSMDWEPVADARESMQRLQTTPQVEIRGNPLFVFGTRLESIPGEYTLSTLVIDPETGRRASLEEKIVLPDYSGNDLMISDILPAASISDARPDQTGRFIRGDLEIIPLPGRNIGSDQPLFIYFEIYNLSLNQFGTTRYRIEYSVSEIRSTVAPVLRIYQGLKNLLGIDRQQAVLSSEFEQSSIRMDTSTYLEIDISEPPAGVYLLTIKVTDMIGGQTASSGLTFRTLPPIPPGIHQQRSEESR